MPAGTLSNFDLIADPGSLIPLATFVLHGLRLESSTDDSFGALYFTIDSLHRAPEPGTIALIGIGFAGFAFARMRSIQTGRH